MTRYHRGVLTGGILRRYELAATGVTSDPTIFDLPIGRTALYDDAIRACWRASGCPPRGSGRGC